MEQNSFTHEICIDNRKEIMVTGVEDCLRFDEETIILKTKLGRLTIKGTGLHIESFNTDNGDIKAVGKIHAVAYTAEESKSNFLNKVFR